MSAQRGTRGFYSLGVPVIFMRSDVIARLAPDVWDYASEDGPTRTDSLTILHEIRHFHDSLIAPFLFRRFILETQRCYIALNFLATAPEDQLFRPLDRSELPNELRSLMEFHDDSLAGYRATYGDFERDGKVHGVGEIDFSDILESLAVLTEIASLIESSGEAEAYAWWCTISECLPSMYSRLIGTYLSGDKFVSKVRTLGWLLMSALYSGEHPVSHLNELLSRGMSPDDVKREIAPNIEISNRHAMSEEIYTYVGFDDVPDDEEEVDLARIAQVEMARRSIVLPSDLRAVRSECFARMANANFDLLAYAAAASEFSVPPICFFTDETVPRSTVLPFARRAALRNEYGDVYSISTSRDSTHRTMISCGLIPCKGYRPFVRLNTVDTMLSTRFMSQRLFGDRVAYCPEMDRAYSGIYQSHVSSGG